MICSINKIALVLSAVYAVSAAPIDTNAERFARGLPPLPPSRTGAVLRARQSPGVPQPQQPNIGFPANFIFTSTYDVRATPDSIVKSVYFN